MPLRCFFLPLLDDSYDDDGAGAIEAIVKKAKDSRKK